MAPRPRGCRGDRDRPRGAGGPGRPQTRSRSDRHRPTGRAGQRPERNKSMTDPQIALLMLGIFIFVIFLGFPIAFTLMALGIGFGYYAYFDGARMWRAYNRAVESDADWWTLTQTWVDGFFNNRVFDLFVNQT